MTASAQPSARTARTRERLLAAALDLFSRNGYDGTTVAQVAAAAGVTEMTFYRHFGSKEALLLEDPYDPLMVAAVGRQPVALPPIVRVVRGVRTAWEQVPIEDAAPVRERVRIAGGSPALRASMHANTRRSQEAIARQLVDDGADAVAAAVASSAVMAALMTALLLWAQGEDADLGAAITGALDVLDVGAGPKG
ncbi:TetR/AcrR family transcriptional regulator [Kineosporia sp. A_224]|uniref:TetR/AcrR family transcriptional regulator n=1 Tax=Kineosporia sp. A_224 TaxID=1962180 RepID=UPI0018E9AC5C|nr:TetR/AcrR family transcriptional regulator [Kineosporia sp. A_224]